MSIVPKETIEVIAQSIGINNLSTDVFPSLSSDVEYRVREIMQEAIKCMRHSRRTVLMADDVDSALKLRNVEPIYGFASGDPLRFKRATGHKDLFYIDDKDVEFKEVIEAPLPKAPLDTALIAHWLAIEGVQPALPENATSETLGVPPDGRKSEYKEDGISVEIKLPVKHVLSRELQLYFDKITDLTVKKSDSVLFKEALMSLATDPGLHPLVPYFTFFIADEVTRGFNDFSLLFAMMRLARSLLQNPHLHIEPYLHQLMPSVLTCLVAKRLGNTFSDNHWELRNFTAHLAASICKRFGHVYHNLQPRVTRTLLHTFLDPTKALPQHYGAIQGLAALGPNVPLKNLNPLIHQHPQFPWRYLLPPVRLLVLPNLEPYLQLLEPEMQINKHKNEMKRHEALRVYGGLLFAAGLCVYDRLKMFPSLLSPPNRSIWKSTGKVSTTMPKKRKASMDNMMQQPPLKKVAIDGPMGAIPTNSLTEDMQGATGGFPTTLVGPNAGLPSTSRQLTNENISASGVRRGGVSGQALKMSKHMDTSHLLPLLTEHFGESMLSFVPTPELSFFL